MSVSLSQAGIVSVFSMEVSFPPSYTLRCKEIRLSPKIWVLPSGTLSQTRDLENFATAGRSRCQQNSSTTKLVDDAYDASRLLTARRSTVTL